jgi:8-oxo-dGTP diphosphatase
MSTQITNEGRFQVAVGAIIQHRSTREILLIHRAPSQYAGNIWELPIGRTKQFESLENGLRREVAEETGITDLQIGRPISVFEFMRGEHSAENEVRAIVFEAQTKQQEVKLSEEHDSFKWLPINEAIELVGTPGIKQNLMTFRDTNHSTHTEGELL